MPKAGQVEPTAPLAPKTVRIVGTVRIVPGRERNRGEMTLPRPAPRIRTFLELKTVELKTVHGRM